MSKSLFAWRVQAIAAQLGEIGREVKDLTEVYIDRGYGSTNPLTDVDITTTPEGKEAMPLLTLAEFNQVAGVLVDVVTFLDGGAVAAADRMAVLNRFTRKDV